MRLLVALMIVIHHKANVTIGCVIARQASRVLVVRREYAILHANTAGAIMSFFCVGAKQDGMVSTAVEVI